MKHESSLSRPSSPCTSSSSNSSSVEIIGSTFPRCATSPSINRITPPIDKWNILTTNPTNKKLARIQFNREHAARAKANRLWHGLSRFEAHVTFAEKVAKARPKQERRRIKESANSILKKACMSGEIKRTKRTKIRPETFETIDFDEPVDHNGNISHNNFEHLTSTLAEPQKFVGQIIVDFEVLDAMTQVICDEYQPGYLRLKQRCHSFYVDAAVSRKAGKTGLAVVNKTHRQDPKSAWTIRGYRIYKVLSQETAEILAIWQALRVMTERVLGERASSEHNAISLVIYSDCKSALMCLQKGGYGWDKAIEWSITQSVILQKLGVEVELHWVPGHRNVPGNELADLVAKASTR